MLKYVGFSLLRLNVKSQGEENKSVYQTKFDFDSHS